MPGERTVTVDCSESGTGMEAVMHEAVEAVGPAAPKAPPKAPANGLAAMHRLHQQAGRTLSHLPKREPVEVKFQELSYTVSLGFRKGE